jgi:hypothetical protein
MKAASTGGFSISLPTKDPFELRIKDPSLTFGLAASLLHLLSLVLEQRNTQWVVAQIDQLDELLGKWQWCEIVKTAKSFLWTANIDVATVLLRESIHHDPRQAMGALKLLLRQTQRSVLDADFQAPLPSVETALDAIVTTVNHNKAFKSIVVASNLPDALRNIPPTEQASFSPKLSGIIIQILEMANPARSETSSDNPRIKRRHIETLPTIDAVFRSTIFDSLDLADGNSPHEFLERLETLVTTTWPSLDDATRVSVTEGIGLLCCAAVGKLKCHSVQASSVQTYKCSICDGAENSTPSKEPLHISVFLSTPLMEILLKEQSSRLVNIAAIRAFGRLAMHDSSPNVISLFKSPLAEVVLKLLNSEYRDQRIAVAQTLPLLFKDRDSEALSDILKENRQMLFRHLRKIQSSSLRDKPLLETTVMAYSEIGKVATQSELNLILLTLVDFLGHKNSFIAALAYRELLSIATAHGQSTYMMFSPCWPSVSIKVIEQMKSRPQILQRLAEILEIRDSVFLVRTQNFTVPFLVLGRHRDVLQQMSQKMGVRMWEMLGTNMPFILAGLLTQENRQMETGIEFLVSLMAANAAGKPTIDTRSLIITSRSPLTIELLKMLASESDAMRERVFQALQMVAIYVSEKPIHDAKGIKAQEYLKLYLQNNILELMNHFTDIITDKRGRKTFTEKIGCIAGIQEIIRFAAAASKTALPQVFPQSPS